MSFSSPIEMYVEFEKDENAKISQVSFAVFNIPSGNAKDRDFIVSELLLFYM